MKAYKGGSVSYVLGAAEREAIAKRLLPYAVEVGAALGRPMILVAIDPMDPLAARLMPDLARRYAATEPGLRPHAALVVAGGGVSMFSAEAAGVVCHDSKTEWCASEDGRGMGADNDSDDEAPMSQVPQSVQISAAGGMA